MWVHIPKTLAQGMLKNNEVWTSCCFHSHRSFGHELIPRLSTTFLGRPAPPLLLGINAVGFFQLTLQKTLRYVFSDNSQSCTEQKLILNEVGSHVRWYNLLVMGLGNRLGRMHARAHTHTHTQAPHVPPVPTLPNANNTSRLLLIINTSPLHFAGRCCPLQVCRFVGGKGPCSWLEIKFVCVTSRKTPIKNHSCTQSKNGNRTGRLKPFPLAHSIETHAVMPLVQKQ